MSYYKITVLGAPGVGKSCLTIQLVQNHFVEEYDPTIHDTYRKKVCIDDECCMIEICDTAFDTDIAFQALRDQFIRDADAFLLVYSITSRSTLDEIEGISYNLSRVKDMEQSSLAIDCYCYCYCYSLRL
uniref:Small monomeric GTPase n=1 Tax=Paramoeba aestuarina TaxID=180227 RepID=A0A7S4KTI1_9EUKA|mmetsp:Transcript_24953/g.38835  ORF Transcript_24953/g.38835 Transcript_24953/m.38835 type:complete len:129 (+) Transcript_24953:114-500(+)